LGPVLLILFGSPPVSWWGRCCSSYSIHLWCFGGAHVAHLIRFTSGVLVGPVLLILFGSPPVFWWGRVAHLIRFTSGFLVGPVLLILFGSSPVFWWGPCCSSYSVHLWCLGGACLANLIRFTFGAPPRNGGEPNKMSNTGPETPKVNRIRLARQAPPRHGARVAHLIRFASGVLVGPVLLILFGSPPVSWWGPCCSSYSVHLRCLGGSCVAHLIPFTSGDLVGPVLLILFGSPPVSWCGPCCLSYSVHLRCLGGARVAHFIRFTSGVQDTRGEPNKMCNTGTTKTPEVNRIR
jgi:hypothetical protein